MKRTFLLIAVTLLCGFMENVRAQTVSVVDTKELSSHFISSICQDKDGFVWIGTEYGLNKFDGTQFTRYVHEDGDSTSLKGNAIRALHKDREGRFWIGSGQGLQYYVPEQDAFCSVRLDGSPDYSVNEILESRNGELWVISSGRGVLSVDREKEKLEKVRWLADLCRFAPEHIFEDSRGRVWISAGAKGLYCIDVKSRSLVCRFEPPAIPTVSFIREDKEGCVFIATSRGIMAYDETENRFGKIPSDISGLDVRDMAVGPDGKIYVASFGGGVYVIDSPEKGLRLLRLDLPAFDVNRAKVVSLFWDKDQDLWIGCFQGGIVLYTSEQGAFRSWCPSNETKAGSAATSVMQDTSGRIWAGIERQGVTCLNAQEESEKRYLDGRTVVSLFEDSEGCVWAGDYYSGAFRIDPKSGAVTRVLDSFWRIKCIAEGRDKRLYIASLGKGVACYDLRTDTCRRLDNKDEGRPIKLKNEWVNTLLPDSEGLLWIGHYKGIDCYDLGKEAYIRIPDASVLDRTVCYALLEDRGKNVWIGTDKGLFRWERAKGTIKRYTVKQGLSNEVICGLAEDERGNVWCSTFRGLNKIEPDGRIVCYYTGNGLKDQEFVRGVYNKGKNGTLLWGTNSGITYFLPAEVEPFSFDKKPVMTGMQAGDREINHALSCADITLSYKDNIYSFEFSTMDYRHAESIRYEYRLAELGDEWATTLPGYSRITFSHLPWGSYTLEVRACFEGTHSPVARWNMRIAPPWYFSVWAWLVYVLVAAGVCFRFYRSVRRKRINRRNAEKLKIFIDLAHEIRSPMTMILNPAESLLREDAFDGRTQKALRSIYKNACRIMGLIGQMLDISKIDRSLFRLEYSETDIVGFIDDVCQTFEYRANERNITLKFEHEQSELSVWIDRNNFDKVLVNLLSNAFKYTPDGGEVTVRLRTERPSKGGESGWAEISVMDSGKGIETKDLKKIFDRFYQASGSSFGYGIGLNLTKMLVGLHHGTIRAFNRTDRSGSCFVVRIPLGKAHIDPADIVEPSVEPLHPVVLPEEEKMKKPRVRTNYRLLVVDDDKDLCDYLSAEFSDTYKVMVAYDGEQGMKIALSELPDLVISDLKMPVADGIALTKELKKNSNTSHIPIILFTTQSEREQFVRSFEAKADAFLNKPFRMEELRMLVTSLLANRALLKGKYSGSLEQADKMKEIEVKSADDALMERVMEIINKHLDDPEFSVDFLADHVGLSRVSLYRKMKEITGISGGEFIRNIRMKQAAKLLEDGKLNVSQVAGMVGFVSNTHFSTVFKKYYGVTPTEYMAKKKQS